MIHYQQEETQDNAHLFTSLYNFYTLNNSDLF